MEDEQKSWRGIHVSDLKTSLNLPQYPRLISDEEHTVLVKYPIIHNHIPECYPSIFRKRDYWDGNHVKLPCSEKNVTKDQINRWNIIRSALNANISTSQHLENAILNYNKRYANHWNFSALHSFFEEALDEAETTLFFDSLLPKIIVLALRLPELITGGIPLLKRGHKHSISMSQLQISCLLANAFLCTFPHRNSNGKDSEYYDYPDINFNRLFQCGYAERKKCTHEKMKCLLNYFRRVTSSTPTGIVTFSRQFVPNSIYPDWSKSAKKLPRLYISSTGTIEDDGFALFQVDFANKFVGGGVIGSGCVQEEIRFVICPELIISRLFTQCLGENEALVVTGCERFNKYKGYGSNFEWDGDYVDETPNDEAGRKYCVVIALDASYYHQNPDDQYLPQNVLRDINKAYVGFSWGSRRKKNELCAVATGNWGCGAFRGNPQLKSFLQLMVAAEVGRDLAYFTFGNAELRDAIANIYQFLFNNEVTVGILFNLLLEYNSKKLFNSISLFEYFRSETLKVTSTIEEVKNSYLTSYDNMLLISSIRGYQIEFLSPPSPTNWRKSNDNVSSRTDNVTNREFFMYFTQEHDVRRSIAPNDNGIPKLAITKRSFCCRTKINDWCSRFQTKESPLRDSEQCKIGDSIERGLIEKETRLLADLYKPAVELAHDVEKRTKDGDDFEILNKFKLSLRRSIKGTAARHRISSSSFDEESPRDQKQTERIVCTENDRSKTVKDEFTQPAPDSNKLLSLENTPEEENYVYSSESGNIPSQICNGDIKNQNSNGKKNQIDEYEETNVGNLSVASLEGSEPRTRVPDSPILSSKNSTKRWSKMGDKNCFKKRKISDYFSRLDRQNL